MVYDLFTRALALPATDRDAFLHAQCSDESILTQVLALLSTDASDDGFTLSPDFAKETDLYFQQALINIGDHVSVYQISDELGRGGMGTVFKAQRIDGNFEQTVAIKIISHHLYKTLDINRLNSEANFMAKLNHNNICKVFDAGITESGVHYIVMEYIEGLSVSSFFADTKITLQQKLNTFSILCKTVNYAHQKQIVHGDLKPANIIFTNNGQIKVLDFGIAQIINEQNLSLNPEQKIHWYALTSDYASPELINGDKPSVYSDVYALGKILFHLLEHSHADNSRYYSEMRAITCKATATITTERYASASELENDIRMFLSGYVVSVYQANHFYRANKFVFERHPISVAISLFFIIIFSTLIVNLIIQYRDLQSERYQTDLMLEKFSLVLDLDYNAKSDVEMTLANNYESRNKDEKAEPLYKKIISRFDLLNDTDVAFDAGSRLIKLLIKTQQFLLIESTLGHLKNRLQFFPQSHLPVTASQAMFYHFFVNSSYHRSKNNNQDVFKFHTKLMHDIKEQYWQELTNQQKAELFYSMAIGDSSQTLAKTSSYYPAFEKVDVQDSLLTIASASKIKSYINQSTIKRSSYENNETKNFPEAKYIINFLESAPLFWASTNEKYFSYEEMNQAILFAGAMKFKENSGLYHVNNHILSTDFGEGNEDDSVLYVSNSGIGLSVDLAGGDLLVLAHKDFSSGKNNEYWAIDELINNTWYHIYDNSLNLPWLTLIL
jgi:serine/threonine protein kinase